MNWRAHGLTSLYWAALAAWGVLWFGHFDVPGFDDRIVSNATLHAVDVGARVRTYGAALAAFVVASLVVLRLLTRFERAIGERPGKNLEQASAAGLLLVALAGVTSLETDAVLTCAALEVAYLLCTLVGARVRGSVERDQHGFAFLVVAAAAYGVLAVTPLRTNALAVASLATIVLFVLALVERSKNARLVAFALAFSAALSAVPLALVVREEIVLVANQRGIQGVSHAVASIPCAITLLVAGWMLSRRRPIDVERLLVRVTFPALILGFAFVAWWTPTRDPQHEMLESGNAGLALQQWFEHGRWPFFDTFDVHGMSDCLMGFVYSWCNGWSGLAWQHWDFVAPAFVSVALYVLLSRVLGHAPFAFVLVVASPFVRTIFPPDVAMAAAFALVAAWSAGKRSTSAFVLVACAWIALVVWRLDLGGGAAVALVATWIAVHLCERPAGFAWKRALAGSALVAALAIVCVIVVAGARDVDLAARFAELRRIASSDTAFGRARIFETFDASVAFRLCVAPALTLVLALLMAIRARRFEAEASRRRFATRVLLFLAAFSLVIFTRGLVRHTFVEHDGTYVTAFQFAVIACAPVVLASPERRRASLVAALALHALVPLAFDLAPEKARILEWRANILARASIRLRAWSKTPVGDARFERTPISAEFKANNVEPMRALSSAVLTPGETFVDLAASPMLYVFSGARSPHWANHLIVLQGDVLQKRFLAELEGERAPLLVMRQEFDLAERAGMIADVTIDEIPIALWHARIFDELMSRSEPFTMAGRWQVWARSDWAPAREWGPPGERLGEIPIGARSETYALESGSTFSLALLGKAPGGGRISISAIVENDVFEERIVRVIEWRAGTEFELIDLVSATRPTRVVIERCAAEGGLALERIRARRTDDPARAQVAERAELPLETELGATALAWGTHDRVPRSTVTALLSFGDAPRAIVPGTPERFFFAPRGRAERSLLCEIGLENRTKRTGDVIVRYGVGDLVGGSFRFGLATQAAPAVYVFRPGMQANWHRRPNDWIEIESAQADVVVHSLRLCAND